MLCSKAWAGVNELSRRWSTSITVGLLRMKHHRRRGESRSCLSVQYNSSDPCERPRCSITLNPKHGAAIRHRLRQKESSRRSVWTPCFFRKTKAAGRPLICSGYGIPIDAGKNRQPEKIPPWRERSVIVALNQNRSEMDVTLSGAPEEATKPVEGTNVQLFVFEFRRVMRSSLDLTITRKPIDFWHGRWIRAHQSEWNPTLAMHKMNYGMFRGKNERNICCTLYGHRVWAVEYCSEAIQSQVTAAASCGLCCITCSSIVNVEILYRTQVLQGPTDERRLPLSGLS